MRPSRRAFPANPSSTPCSIGAYAEEIAEKWNTRDAASGFKGYVTEFEVEDGYIARYPVQTAGASHHQELWVPAEELDAFNAHIVRKIRVVGLFSGPS